MKVTALDIYRNKYEVPVGEVAWRPSVYGIVLHDGKMLLSPQYGIGYDLPGGGVEIYETFEQAVVREVREETGIDVRPIQTVGDTEAFFVLMPDDKEGRSVYHSIMRYYLCEVVGGDLSTDGFDAEDREYVQMAEWVDISQLDSLQQACSVDFREYIRKAIQIHGD